MCSELLQHCRKLLAAVAPCCANPEILEMSQRLRNVTCDTSSQCESWANSAFSALWHMLHFKDFIAVLVHFLTL